MQSRLCWINVGPEGRFRQSGSIFSRPSDVDYLLGDALEGRTKLVLHFHGGLVSEAAGKAIAEAMASHYGNSAASVGLVWETGIVEVFRDNLRKIHSLKAFRKALSWVIAKALPALGAEEGARGAAGAIVDHRAIERLLATEAGVTALDAALSSEAVANTAKLRARGGDAETPLIEEAVADELALDLSSDPELLEMVERRTEGGDAIADQLPSDAAERGISLLALAGFLAKLVIAVVRRYRQDTHHDLVATAVEELLRAAYLAEVGQFAWAEMKHKAFGMWADDGPQPNMEGHVGGYLLRRLEVLRQTRPEVSVDLVGHSAGSIAIAHMFRAIEDQRRDIAIRNVAFLAPAVRLDVFAAEIARRPDRFARFRSFTMCDDWEKRDKLVSELYPRSLLFFISGLLEDRPGVPLAGLARHITRRSATAGPEFDDIRAWLAASDRLVLSPSADTAGSGLRTRSARHGDFDNDPITLASLLALAELQS